ncbi:MAG: fumarylacetoacetate hydrolase family protein [Firmicutes bacterium]|nr:fumarylacetoacetate hydrolase family protein [Bacillota bacterium]
MKLVTYEWHQQQGLGLVVGDKVLDLMAGAAKVGAGLKPAQATEMKALLAHEGGLELAREVEAGAKAGLSELKAAWLPQAEIKLKAPLLNPDKIICIGLNYRDHAEESNQAVPKEPVIFGKYANSIIGPEEDILLPTGLTDKVDFEAELAVVIGRRAADVPPEDALAYVAGYTNFNDVSARDLQMSGGQWMKGKCLDTFAPMGPWLVTTDEIPQPDDLEIKLKLNGQVMQSSSTANMIFGVAELVSFLSQLMTLNPGDVIATGTPAGVGFARRPPVYLAVGDVIEVEIEGLGTLRNKVAEKPRS